MRRAPSILLVLLAGMAFLAACGDDDDDTGTVGADDGNGVVAPPEYTITATETDDGSYAFDVPDDVAGGVVTITLKSAAENKEPHDFQLVKVEDGADVDALIAGLGEEEAPVPEWLHNGAGVGTIAPGQSSTATFKLEPDTEYAFFCTEGGDKGGHGSHGMSGTFTTGDDSGASMPEAAATITASEYEFEIDGLKAGSNTVAFTNKGTMLHHVLFVPFTGDATLDEIKTLFESEEEPTGPPPIDFEKLKGSAVAGIGDTIVFDLELEAGRYAVLCFMPDLGTAGPPHVAKGMLQELTVS